MDSTKNKTEYKDEIKFSTCRAWLPEELCDDIASDVHNLRFKETLEIIAGLRLCHWCDEEGQIGKDGSGYIYHSSIGTKPVTWALSCKLCYDCHLDYQHGERWYRKCDECDYVPTDEDLELDHRVGFPEDTDWSLFPEDELVPCWEYHGCHAAGWLCKDCLGDAIYYDNKD